MSKRLGYCHMHQNSYVGFKCEKCEANHNKWIAGKLAPKEKKPVLPPDPCAGCDFKGGLKERRSCLMPTCVRENGWAADRLVGGGKKMSHRDQPYLISSYAPNRARQLAEKLDLKEGEWVHVPLGDSKARLQALADRRNYPEAKLVGTFSNEERTELTYRTGKPVSSRGVQHA